MTDERAMKLARKIAADAWYPQKHVEHYIEARERILSGDYDRIVHVQSVLAAIKATTQLAAEKATNIINEMREECETDLRSVRSRLECAFRDFTHLPADGGENV